MINRNKALLTALLVVVGTTCTQAALQSFIQMKSGYFYDPSAGKPWVPHGIAYQTWNRPLGVWQTFDQIDYDLDEMKKMGANSIRVDFVWQHIEEQGDDIWSWTNYDYLLQAAEKRGLRVFALVGYQWPPSWFPDAYYTMHPPGYDSEGIYHSTRWQSDIINYEHPQARAQYSNFLYTVCSRYKDSKAVAGWIVGNEYGYLGLWSLKYDGYDPECEQAFRNWCSTKYGSVTALNAAWNTAYTNFGEIVLVDDYAWKGAAGAEWADMVQWREDSIANFTAAGARAARAGDTNHLLSYSTVGMQWGEEDWRYHAEDRGKIAQACASNNASLSYFSINNYPWAMDGSETRNGQWGISFTKKTAGIPVLYTETGFTSSEDLFPGLTEARQGGLIRNALWESLEAGSIGTHIFTWQDRPWITDREKGFGILYGDRVIKPAFWTSRNTFNLMDEVNIHDLLAGSKDPKPDIAFLWDEATDSQYVRFENEMQHEAGALERLGFEPSFILGLGELASGAYTNYKAIVLPRNMRVSDTVPGRTNSVLNFLLTQVLPKGIHVIAVADLPGMQDRWGKPRAAFSNEVAQLFGIDASDVGGVQPPGDMYESILRQYYHKISVRYNTNGPAGLKNYAYSPSVWKCNDRVRVNGTNGTVWAVMDSGTNRGYEASASSVPGWYSWGNVEVRQWGWQYEGTNMVQLWGWSGMWQDFIAIPGQKYTADAYMRSNTDDGLSGGSYGVVSIEWYDSTGTNRIGSAESARLTAPNNAWQSFSVSSIAPSNVSFGRIVRKLDRATNAPLGSLYFDAESYKPAVVAKSHGAGKAVIILYSLDTLPDGNGDGEPDNLPYKWRSDILGGILKDYCGLQPLVQATGSNAYLCLPEYRTCTNGATLWQIKNYLYDTNFPGGGAPQTYTIQSSLFTGKTVRAFEQGRILATNCNGTVQVTLDPDGHEMLLAYVSASNRPICQIADAPAVVHPFGDKNYQIKVNYDTLGKTNLTLKISLVGGKTGNQALQTLATNVTGFGQLTLWMWIPDFDLSDTNYVSTPDGGQFSFVTWLEDPAGNRVTDLTTQSTELKWGVRPMTNLPTTVAKGGTVNTPIEWEDLYEYLPWQNTPMTRNDTFPARVAVFRSTKTEAQFPGHLGRVNQVCSWLESMGYQPGNNMDVSFDNVIVALGKTNSAVASIAFTDAMESGTNGWTADGLWHQAKDMYFSASNSWSYNNGSNYNTGARNTGALITPWISLSNATAASLSFRSWYQTEDSSTSWDKKLVYISTDGTNWMQALQISGPNVQWTAQTCDLSTYAGRRIKVKFVFDSVDGVYNAFKGWVVDDVKVTKSSGTSVDLFYDNMESTTNWTPDGLWRKTGSRSGADVSGTNRWVYNRDAANTNYNTGAVTRGSLVSRWIDLATASSASLSLKSWYQTEDTGTAWDRKRVYVSADGTNWTQILQISGPDRQWTTQTFDLGAYVGQRIKLKLSFDSIDNINNGFEGWYMDDVRITTISGTGVPVFSDTMETGTNGWMAAGLWHQAGDLCVSPATSWAYNNGSNYVTGTRNSGALLSPWLDLASAASATLNFRSWYETEDAGTSWDRKLVYVTTDGTNWTQILQISGPNKQWTSQTVELGQFAGQRIRLRFFFDSIDGVNNGYRGWYLDNVAVNIVGSDMLFAEGFTSTNLAAWSRAAGAANWTVTNGGVRAWRIGNDDNILCAGDASWSNYTASVDIRYNKQGPYFNDAELYLRYVDRNNFVKIGIVNFYGAWRLKYTVRVATNNSEQGWICDFKKTNNPVENTWYNLKVRAETNTFTVFFNGDQVGAFTSKDFPYSTGKIAVGSRAVQLGVWEPQKGYFFIDDDEYSYYSAVEDESVTIGRPLNLDWGYLDKFFPTLILPSTYVMSDAEAANVVTWLNKGLYSLIATDGGIAMKNETGAYDPGRIESVFGVAAAVGAVSNLTKTTIGTNDHYVTQDYAAWSQLSATGSAMAWTTLTKGRGLGTLSGSAVVPSLIVNTITNDPQSPKKAFCFNLGADTQGQLTNSLKGIAKRAFEWARGEAHKVRIELKYTPVRGSQLNNFVVRSWDQWVLGSTGSNNLSLVLPDDGIMTGENMYWVMYMYPWDASDAWLAHDGFYTSANDGTNGLYTSIPGVGLQIIGAPLQAFGGRNWDMWAAYNTRGTSMVVTVGLKDKGTVQVEDNFNDGNYSGWHVIPSSNYLWSVTPTGTLKCTTAPAGGYSMMMKDGFDVSDQNITYEYDVKFNSGTEGGGIIYRGHVLYINPQGIWWSTDNPLNMSSGTASNFSGLVTNADGSVSYVITGSIFVYIGPPGLTVGDWHHVSVSIRDGDPNLKSDIIIDGQYAAMMEDLPFTNWTDTGVGFLSPYRNGTCEWDNARIVDEQYSFYSKTVNGEVVPTNATEPTFWVYTPDYDPDIWEYDGTSAGGQYEWYAYFRGQNIHGKQDVGIYFAPRLMTEVTNFPQVINAGQTVQVPVEWENLPEIPRKLRLQLVEPYTGAIPVSNDFDITNANGSAYFTMTVPASAASSINYLWAASVYPPGSTNPAAEKLGLDDTFRFDTLGVAVMPEVLVAVSAGSSDDQLGIYNDGGLSAPAEVYVWQGSVVTTEGNYTNIAVPEGVKCFYCSGNWWQGWGVFSFDKSIGIREPRDMRAYTNGFLKFWLKSTVTAKVQIEDNIGWKGTKYVPSTSNVWKEITIPISELTGADLSIIYGLFEITTEAASTFYVDDVRWVKGVYRIYRDAGIPAGSDVITWQGGAATFNGDFVDATVPEGVKCFLTDCSSWAGWGVAITNGAVDLSLYSNGYLRFWAKSTKPLKVEVEGPVGTKRTKNIASTGGGWQELAIPISDFSGVNLSQVYSPFEITAETGTTYFVDDVRWMRGTNTAVAPAKSMIYWDSGIPAGTDVFVWWASQYWDHVSGLINDGGFEESATGSFPDAGYWTLSTAGGSATAQCLAASARTLLHGLRSKTGSEAGAYWASTYQEYTAYAGDIYKAEAYVRQPSDAGGTWIAGSEAYMRLQFLDAWHQGLTNMISPQKVTADNQGWTQCVISNATAPVATRFVRLDLVVAKPNGASGVSVADFDDCRLGQANSFNGNFAEDPAPPEGAQVFRSYCVNWSGWGIFYTNTVADMSAYSNGYLKFWLKSSGYTKIELQSLYNNVTNTGLGAFYNPTTNESGTSVWQYKVIPITNFTGVVLTHIKSPFMATDPVFDNSYSVDYVTWELSP